MLWITKEMEYKIKYFKSFFVVYLRLSKIRPFKGLNSSEYDEKIKTMLLDRKTYKKLRLIVSFIYSPTHRLISFGWKFSLILPVSLLK